MLLNSSLCASFSFSTNAVLCLSISCINSPFAKSTFFCASAMVLHASCRLLIGMQSILRGMNASNLLHSSMNCLHSLRGIYLY